MWMYRWVWEYSMSCFSRLTSFWVPWSIAPLALCFDSSWSEVSWGAFSTHRCSSVWQPATNHTALFLALCFSAQLCCSSTGSSCELGPPASLLFASELQKHLKLEFDALIWVFCCGLVNYVMCDRSKYHTLDLLPNALQLQKYSQLCYMLI